MLILLVWAQSKKYGLDLSLSFLVTEQSPDVVKPVSLGQPKVQLSDAGSSSMSPVVVEPSASWETFIAAQHGDVTLSKGARKIVYGLDDSLLMSLD